MMQETHTAEEWERIYREGQSTLYGIPFVVIWQLWKVAQERNITAAELVASLTGDPMTDAEGEAEKRGWENAMRRAQQLAREAIEDIDTNFRTLSSPKAEDHITRVCHQAQRNGVRFVLKRLSVASGPRREGANEQDIPASRRC